MVSASRVSLRCGPRFAHTCAYCSRDEAQVRGRESGCEDIALVSRKDFSEKKIFAKFQRPLVRGKIIFTIRDLKELPSRSSFCVINVIFLASLSEGGAPKGRKESPRRRKARNAGDVYRHPRAIYACVSFSQKIFCFAKSFLGALSYEPPLCKGRWLAVRRLAEAARRRDC